MLPRLTSLTLALVALGAPTFAHASDYTVGPSGDYPSLCALAAAVTLAAGDTVEVASGTYGEACILRGEGTESAPIVLRGAAGTRPIIDGSGMNLTGAGSVPRGVLQFNGATHWEVSHLELTGAHNDTNNAAGFRLTANSHDLVFRDMVIHDNDNGIFSDSGAVFALEDSEVYENGAGDGYSHNMYLNGTSVRLEGNYIHDSRGGQNVKLRVHYAEILGNRIVHGGNYEMDFIQSDDSRMPNSNIVLIGNVIVRRADADNHGQTIVFGSDNGSDAGRTGNVYAFHNTFVLTHASNRLFHAINPGEGARIYFTNNAVYRTVDGADLASDAATEAIFEGANNWIVDGMTVPSGLTGTLRGADPAFAGAMDYRPADGSPLIDEGAALDTLSYTDGDGASHPGAPAGQPSEPMGTTPRPVVGAPDIGAYEHGTPPATGDGGTAGADGGVSPGDDAGSLPGSDGGGTRRDAGAMAGGGDDDGGCGCRVAARSHDPAPLVALLLLPLALALRRRRR